MQALARRSTAGWAVLLLLLSLIPLLALPAVAVEKITICHAAGLDGTTKFVTLEVARQAAFGQAGHFYENGTPRAGHEQDYLGACDAPTDPDREDTEEGTDDTTATTEVTTPDLTEESTSDVTTPETTEESGTPGTTEDPHDTSTEEAEDAEGTEGEDDSTSDDDTAGPTVLPPDTKVTEDPIEDTPTPATQPETEVAAAVVSAPPASVPASVTAAPVSPPAVVTAPPADATVAAVFVAPDTLPFTGAESTTHMAYGASILLAGAAFVLAGRERKIGRHEAR